MDLRVTYICKTIAKEKKGINHGHLKRTTKHIYY